MGFIDWIAGKIKGDQEADNSSGNEKVEGGRSKSQKIGVYRDSAVIDLTNYTRDNLAGVLKEMIDNGEISPQDLNAKLRKREKMRDVILEMALVRYGAQYEKMDKDSKLRCSREEVENRLLAQDSHYLRLAERLNQKGILFGVDEEGNPLFADGGEGPILIAMTYVDTRNVVLFKSESGKLVESGYEMFPYKSEKSDKKSLEIQMFEAYTGKPFVKSAKGDEWRSSWLESGERPKSPHSAFIPANGRSVSIVICDQGCKDPERGIRRLLRVKK